MCVFIWLVYIYMCTFIYTYGVKKAPCYGIIGRGKGGQSSSLSYKYIRNPPTTTHPPLNHASPLLLLPTLTAVPSCVPARGTES